MKRREKGDRGEKAVCDHLKKRGHKIIETNYYCTYGEIDIVSRQKKCLVFTEVRTRTGTEFGTAEESITEAKQGRMRSSAYHYAQTHEKIPEEWRIDVAAVEMDADGSIVRIDIIENAVGDE